MTAWVITQDLIDQGGIDEEIPGTQYEILGEDKFLYYPQNLDLTITLAGTGAGTFNYDISNITENGTQEVAKFFELPVTLSTTGEVIFDGINLDQALIQLDHNDDGVVDEEFSPDSVLDETQAQDLTPPTTTLSLTGVQGDNDWFVSEVEVSLEAVDNAGGVGVLETRYSLDSGQNWQTYTEPFIINEEGIHTLQYYSFDLAGNTESTQAAEIKIDLTAPEFNVYYDLETEDIVFVSPDAQVVCQVHSCEAIDEAGNTTQLMFHHESHSNLHELRLKSIAYNGEFTKLEKNIFEIKTKFDPHSSDFGLLQRFKITSSRVRAAYRQLKDETRVQWQEMGSEEMEEIFEGLKLIYVITNKGLLDWELN
jgi:hypothetical protein